MGFAYASEPEECLSDLLARLEALGLDLSGEHAEPAPVTNMADTVSRLMGSLDGLLES